MKARILIVEDDPDISANLREFFELEGFNVRTASNGAVALKTLRSGEPPPQVVLLDLMMPVMTGMDLCAQLAADPALRQIPVVIMSADAHAEAKSRATHARAVVRKPPDLDSLLALLLAQVAQAGAR